MPDRGEQVHQLIDKVFGEEKREALEVSSFTELKCWDSLHYVQWVVGVQATFKISLTQDQILRLTSFAGLRDVLKEHGILL